MAKQTKRLTPVRDLLSLCQPDAAKPRSCDREIVRKGILILLLETRMFYMYTVPEIITRLFIRSISFSREPHYRTPRAPDSDGDFHIAKYLLHHHATCFSSQLCSAIRERDWLRFTVCYHNHILVKDRYSSSITTCHTLTTFGLGVHVWDILVLLDLYLEFS